MSPDARAEEEVLAALDPAFLAEIDAIPFAPRDVWRSPAHYLSVTKGALDFVAHNLPRVNSVLVRLNPYPRPFERVRVPVDDEGTTLGGWHGPGKPGSPAVVFAPGTFQTKDDTSRKGRAIRFWRDLGCHVLAVDLRGFGDSHESWGTGGYLEAHDLLRAAEWLKARSGDSRVTLVGESLGGASAIIASALPGASESLNGTLAWSPFADLVDQSKYVTTNPGVRHPFFLAYTFYRLMTTVRSGGEVRDFRDFFRVRSAMLGLTADELVRRSSPVTYAQDVAVPTLAFHAEDDPIVPVSEAHRLIDAARGNPLVRARVLPTGAHVSFEEHAPEWYWRTTRAFVAHVNGRRAA